MTEVTSAIIKDPGDLVKAETEGISQQGLLQEQGIVLKSIQFPSDTTIYTQAVPKENLESHLNYLLTWKK